MSNIVLVNGSYRPKGFTSKALKEVGDLLVQKHGGFYHTVFLPEMVACQHCVPDRECVVGCRMKDSFQAVIKIIEPAEHIVFGSPVYLDFPSPKLLAFLSRLNCFAENTNRKWFAGKHAHLVATGYCSGTKTVIHTLMGACEMLGFTILPRSTREYIQLWRDKKVRGGFQGDTLTVGGEQ